MADPSETGLSGGITSEEVGRALESSADYKRFDGCVWDGGSFGDGTFRSVEEWTSEPQASRAVYTGNSFEPEALGIIYQACNEFARRAESDMRAVDHFTVSAISRPHFDPNTLDVDGNMAVARRDFEIAISADSARGAEVAESLVRGAEALYRQWINEVPPQPESEIHSGGRIVFGNEEEPVRGDVVEISQNRSRGLGERLAGALNEAIGHPRVAFADHGLRDRLQAALREARRGEERSVKTIKFGQVVPERPANSADRIVFGDE